MCRKAWFWLLLSALRLLIVSGLVVACGPQLPPAPSPTPTGTPPTPISTPSPVLPNLLVQAEGDVRLRRTGWSDFLPTGFGVAAEPGDLLRVATGGAAAIFCGDESLWDASPRTLPADGVEHGVPCLPGWPSRPAPDIAQLRHMRGDLPGVADEIPYILSPRTGFVLKDRPTLRWHVLAGVEAYTVTLVSDDGQARPAVAARGGELAYPDAWPPLKAGGADYQLIVEGGSRRSDEGGAFGQGFSRLNPDQAARVQSRAAHLRRRPLSEPALTLLLAELHLSHGLRSEAAEMLAALPGGDQIAAIQHRLGEAYLKMGLFAEAEAALERALALAQAAGWQEAEAAAHAGLGLAACGRWDAAEAQGQWKKAQAQYQALEMETQAGEVAGWLKQAQICPPPPTP